MSGQFIQIVPGSINNGLHALLVQFQDGTPIPFSSLVFSEGVDQYPTVTITLLVDGDTVRVAGCDGQ